MPEALLKMQQFLGYLGEGGAQSCWGSDGVLMFLLINNYGMFSLAYSIVGIQLLTLMFMVCEIVVNWKSK